MLRRKHVIPVFAASLIFTLFAGIAVGQSTTPYINEPIQKTGYVSVPAAAFEPIETGYDIRNNGNEVLNVNEDYWAVLVAPVQIPDGVTVTNVTFYYFQDDLDETMYFNLYRKPGLASLADAQSSEIGIVSAYDDTINDPIIDNSQFIYYLMITLPPGDVSLDRGFNYAIIEYEYSVPRFQDASTWVKLVKLPGENIDVYSQSAATVLATQTTNVWHGFRKDDWSTLTEEQQTEFISTAQWHLFVNDEEVLLTHIVKYDTETDRVWSLYYRVFPPGYFATDRNHKLRGEWIVMKDGNWITETREGTLRVYRPLMLP